jgi:hypothetical protein
MDKNLKTNWKYIGVLIVVFIISGLAILFADEIVYYIEGFFGDSVWWEVFFEAFIATSGTYASIGIITGIIIYFFIYKPRKDFYNKIVPIMENKELPDLKRYFDIIKKRIEMVEKKYGTDLFGLYETNRTQEQRDEIIKYMESLQGYKLDWESQILKKETEIRQYKNYSFTKVIQDLLDRKYFK